VPAYIGGFRENTEIEESFSNKMPSFLYKVFDQETGIPNPRYVQNPEGRYIRNGRLEYAE
jgi:hypothetical protein